MPPRYSTETRLTEREALAGFDNCRVRFSFKSLVVRFAQLLNQLRALDAHVPQRAADSAIGVAEQAEQ